jgi:hypothetical protein
MEAVLKWGPCDGDVVTVEDTDVEIRVPIVCGICLDELPTALSKDIYTEGIYLHDPQTGQWTYSGRLRYDQSGNAYVSPG